MNLFVVVVVLMVYNLLMAYGSNSSLLQGATNCGKPCFATPCDSIPCGTGLSYNVQINLPVHADVMNAFHQTVRMLVFRVECS